MTPSTPISSPRIYSATIALHLDLAARDYEAHSPESPQKLLQLREPHLPTSDRENSQCPSCCTGTTPVCLLSSHHISLVAAGSGSRIHHHCFCRQATACVDPMDSFAPCSSTLLVLASTPHKLMTARESTLASKPAPKLQLPSSELIHYHCVRSSSVRTCRSVA